jgi:tRNA(His) 5'-end guanylyltransferase
LDVQNTVCGSIFAVVEGAMMSLRVLVSVNPRALSRVFDSRAVVSFVRSPAVVRLDGVGFGRVLRGRPVRDQKVHEALVEGCKRLAMFFNASFCHAVSDEANLYLFGSLPYGGREFKVVSIASSILSSVASLLLNQELYFDARVIQLDSPWQSVAYYLYRARVGLNNYVSKLYTELVSKESKGLGYMIEELRARGIDIDTDWRSTGTCIYAELVKKEGFNPLKNERVVVTRRVLRSSDDVGACLEKLISIAKSFEACRNRRCSEA